MVDRPDRLFMRQMVVMERALLIYQYPYENILAEHQIMRRHNTLMKYSNNYESTRVQARNIDSKSVR